MRCQLLVIKRERFSRVRGDQPHALGNTVRIFILSVREGLAFAYGHISPAAAADDRALAAQLGIPIPIGDYEAALELTYRYEIAEDWAIQPDVQYIFHPGSNIANPANLNLTPIPNAWVLGVRTALEF